MELSAVDLSQLVLLLEPATKFKKDGQRIRLFMIESVELEARFIREGDPVKVKAFQTGFLKVVAGYWNRAMKLSINNILPDPFKGERKAAQDFVKLWPYSDDLKKLIG